MGKPPDYFPTTISVHFSGVSRQDDDSSVVSTVCEDEGDESKNLAMRALGRMWRRVMDYGTSVINELEA